MEQTIDAQAVADYLRHTPQFFADYADLLAEIFVPHPHGGHAIPIAERQMITLRERNNELERKLRELVRYGTENDTISEKLHRATLALFVAQDLPTTLAVLRASLHEDFGVPQVALRLWPGTEGSFGMAEFGPISTDLRAWADGLASPSCGTRAPFEARDWFEVPAACESFAFLTLRTAHTFGLLGLASDDAQRFHAGMGNVYLIRLAEVASVALARYLPGT